MKKAIHHIFWIAWVIVGVYLAVWLNAHHLPPQGLALILSYAILAWLTGLTD